MSCGEEFLTKEPLSFLSPENTYVDAVGLQTTLDAAIRGIYDHMNGDNEGLMFQQNTSDNSVVSVIVARPTDGYIDMRTYATPQNPSENQRIAPTWKPHHEPAPDCHPHYPDRF